METAAELQERIIELWPRFSQAEVEVEECEVSLEERKSDRDRIEGQLGPLCYRLRKVVRIQRQGKKGEGIKAWCLRAGIDLNRFNYLARKYSPKNESTSARSKSKQEETEGDFVEFNKVPSPGDSPVTIEPDDEYVETDVEKVYNLPRPTDLRRVLKTVKERRDTLPAAQWVEELNWLVGELEQRVEEFDQLIEELDQLRDRAQTQVDSQQREATAISGISVQEVTNGSEPKLPLRPSGDAKLPPEAA